MCGQTDYGTKGVLASTNSPGKRQNHQLLRNPIDHSIWLCGGSSGSGNLYGDVWQYNITSNMWIWIAGANNVDYNGVYGVQGVADSANYPGARNQATAWFDARGNLWLFGGNGLPELGASTGSLNDMWVLNRTPLWWTWVGGSKVINTFGVYGVQNVLSGGWPGGRKDHAAAFDGVLNVYIHGGFGFGRSGGNGPMNDLWRFDLASREWTWIGGNTTSGLLNPGGYHNGRYCTRMIEAASNWPGSRSAHAMMHFGGQLFLFGGNGYPITGSTFLLSV